MCVSGYFLVHSCLDWVDEFPALAAPAIAIPLAAIAAAWQSEPAVGAERVRRVPGALASPIARRVAAAAGVLAAVAVLLALTSSYVSLRLVDRAFATFRSNPQQAYSDLSKAQSINPIDVTPITSEGTIALYQGDTARASRAFERALRRQDDWYPRVELALIDAQDGHFDAAVTQMDAATRLDVDDPIVDQARTTAGTSTIEPHPRSLETLWTTQHRKAPCREGMRLHPRLNRSCCPRSIGPCARSSAGRAPAPEPTPGALVPEL